MDIAGFYDGNEQRRTSEEVSYGDGWTSALDPHAVFKASYVVDTGELYTVREPHPGGLLARYLDELDVDQPGVSAMTVEVLLVEPARERVETLLTGWSTEMEREDSLAWLLSVTAAPDQQPQT